MIPTETEFVHSIIYSVISLFFYCVIYNLCNFKILVTKKKYIIELREIIALISSSLISIYLYILLFDYLK